IIVMAGLAIYSTRVHHLANTFHTELHKTLKADYILAKPPVNASDWGGERLTEDVRWKDGIPPAGNANYAWIQHIVSKLAPSGTDRKSTRLNSSHVKISYAVFCLKKKKLQDKDH